MKDFLLKIFIWTLIGVALAYPLDWIISTQLKKVNGFEGEMEVWNDIYEGSLNHDIAIYGSSRAWVHINPNIIYAKLNKTAYNFGVNGYHFPMQYFRHNEYIENNPSPESIILTLDAGSFQKINYLYNKEQFLPYLLYNERMKVFLSNYQGFETLDYYVPLIRYMGEKYALLKIFKEIVNPQSYLRKDGFAGKSKEWNTDLKKAKEKFGTLQIEIDEQIIIMFEQFLQECKRSNINVILVYPPEYIQGQDFVENRSEIIQLYEEIAENYNISFLNYSNDEISFKRKYFYNSTHLNLNGANLFTNKLINDMMKIGFIKKENNKGF